MSTTKKRRSRSKSLVRARKRQRRQQQVAAESPKAIPRSKPSLLEQCWEIQPLVAPGDMHDLVDTLRRPLPVCVRFLSQRAQDLWYRDRLPQLPRHAVWQVIADVWQVQAPFAGILRGLPQVHRQELVSMLPVWLLRIQPHHQVLDLCASPGSKTIQAVLELETGCCVANELDARRAYVLAHRCQTTLGARATRLAVVTHHGAKFPNVERPLVRDTSFTSTTGVYDRIICDVPCSGDGTLRKDTKVWHTWHPSYGIRLHALQVRIAKRGIALLRVGGWMTYSTCSFHALENEAVVAALLRTGTVELVSVAAPNRDGRIPLPHGLVGRPGWKTWHVVDDAAQIVPSPSDRPDWPASLWADPAAEDWNLQKCIRMVPHDNDTGGFFIALLRKVRDFPTRPSSQKKALVTPQYPAHQLHRVSATTVRRSSSEPCRTVFGLTPSLAAHVLDQPGSAKLNIVQVGLKRRRQDTLATTKVASNADDGSSISNG